MTLSAVGVVGDGPLVDRIGSVVESADVTVARGPASGALEAGPDAVVAVGEPALLDLVREDLDVPVLPVDAGPGYGGVRADDATSAVESLLGGEFETDARDVLGVSIGGERVGRALADAMLVTAEPARISEFAVRSNGELVERFRADGVVVSTPTGSHGYGRNAGGPLLEPRSRVASVVPVAPFAVDADHWVLAADDPVSLSVERDESEVTLLLDDRNVRTVPPNARVEVVADESVELLEVPASRPFFER